MKKQKTLPIVTKETIEEHTKVVRKAKKSGSFKSTSDKIFEKILKENPELADVILPTLESNKSKDFKSGYLAGFTTIYDVLRRQAGKLKAVVKKGEIKLRGR